MIQLLLQNPSVAKKSANELEARMHTRAWRLLNRSGRGLSGSARLAVVEVPCQVDVLLRRDLHNTTENPQTRCLSDWGDCTHVEREQIATDSGGPTSAGPLRILVHAKLASLGCDHLYYRRPLGRGQTASPNMPRTSSHVAAPQPCGCASGRLIVEGALSVA